MVRERSSGFRGVHGIARGRLRRRAGPAKDEDRSRWGAGFAARFRGSRCRHSCGWCVFWLSFAAGADAVFVPGIAELVAKVLSPAVVADRALARPYCAVVVSEITPVKAKKSKKVRSLWDDHKRLLTLLS